MDAGGKIPPSAWRPFERGPRNCMGQDLAIIEARVVLALVVRRFEFEKAGIGRVVVDAGGKGVVEGESGQLRVVGGLYNVSTDLGFLGWWVSVGCFGID